MVTYYSHKRVIFNFSDVCFQGSKKDVIEWIWVYLLKNMQKISSPMSSWTSSIATSKGLSVGCSILWWMLIFNIGGLISYVKLNSKVLYLLAFLFKVIYLCKFAYFYCRIPKEVRKIIFLNNFKKNIQNTYKYSKNKGENPSSDR